MPRILSRRGVPLGQPAAQRFEIPPALKNQRILRAGDNSFIDITELDYVLKPEGCARMLLRVLPEPKRANTAWLWTLRDHLGLREVYAMADFEEPFELPGYPQQWIVTKATRSLDKCRFPGCGPLGLQAGIVYIGYSYR